MPTIQFMRQFFYNEEGYMGSDEEVREYWKNYKGNI